jgi:hypothetical protein
MFLLIKDKFKGMLILSFTIGFTLIFEYFLTLTNLSAANTPMPFPKPFSRYPCRDKLIINKKTDKREYNTAGEPDCTNMRSYFFPFF